MDISKLPDFLHFKYKWRSPYDFNNTFSVPHIYALCYKGTIKYIGKSTGSKYNYYTGGVIPNKLKQLGIKGVIEFASLENIDEREKAWIALLKPVYNIAEGGQGGLVGEKNPAKRDSVKKKIRKAHKGKKLTQEHKDKLKQAKLKNPVKAHKGKKRSNETKQKIKDTWRIRNTEKYKKIEELINQGFYVKEIQETLNVSTSTIAKVKKELGLKGKHNRKRSN